MRGYRGFLREMLRTGSLRALRLQLRVGALHLLGRRRVDPEAALLAGYGLRPPDPERRALALRAQACLACGLCSAECARVGGDPPLDPLLAVLAASRLGASGGRCAGCRACEAVCPVAIPIASLL